MAILTIEGDIKQLNAIRKSIRLRIEKYGLKSSIENNHQEDNDSSGDKPKLTATETADLIKACKTIEDLQNFKDDKRQVVESAYKKKLKEFE